MENLVRVSEKFSKAVYYTIWNYLSVNYKIESGVCQNTRRIYTINDIYSFRYTNLINTQNIVIKRYMNFMRLAALKICNDDKIFQPIISKYKMLKQNIILLGLEDIQTICKYLNLTDEMSEEDKLIDCIMITLVPIDKNKKRWSIVIDFFCMAVD